MSQANIILLIRSNSRTKSASNASGKRKKVIKSLMLDDPRIQKIRQVKDKFRLNSQDLSDLLADQKFIINKNALQQYLQGNVKGTDQRYIKQSGGLKRYSASGRNIVVNHLDDLFAEILKIEARLNIDLEPYISRDMHSVLDDWYRRLGITSPSKERKLGLIIDIDFSTIWKWQRDNRYPKSIATVLAIEKKISAFVA